MRPEDRRYLQHILEACDAVARFTAGVSDNALEDDEVVLSAVLYKFVIVGEASRRVSVDLRSSHAEVPWSQAISLRNFVAHGYDVIRSSIIWRTARTDLPRYARAIQSILDAEFNERASD